MNKFISFAAAGLAGVLSLPAGALPSKFKNMNNATFCSIDRGHSIINLDRNGVSKLKENLNVCITLSEIEDVWKVRIDWWSIPLNKKFVEYALAGWINPKTLAYIESSSSPNNTKIIGEGHIRFIDEDTVNFLQYGVLENGSAAMLSENLTRVETMPIIDLPLEVIN